MKRYWIVEILLNYEIIKVIYYGQWQTNRNKNLLSIYLLQEVDFYV